jgi:hypothetical protein
MIVIWCGTLLAVVLCGLLLLRTVVPIVFPFKLMGTSFSMQGIVPSGVQEPKVTPVHTLPYKLMEI